LCCTVVGYGGSMEAILKSNGPARAIISLQQWLADVGVTACTAWRWRKKGWLKTVNICGRQYLTQEAIEEFTRRAAAGEFAQEHKVPVRQREEAA
jgi:predicted site-specific integrase-resolvase